jgi:hypothetical protein
VPTHANKISGNRTELHRRLPVREPGNARPFFG